MAGSIRFGSLVAAVFVAVLGENVFGEDMPLPTIGVRVHNQAGARTELLDRAQQDVQRIFREAGVQIAWLTSTPEHSSGRFDVRILIRRKPMGLSAGPLVMGTTLGGTYETGGMSFVFLDRVLQRAHEREQDVARLLAYATAHEIGHLLLPYPAHSPTGVMRAEWNGDDLRYIANGVLRFTPAQDALIREKLAECCDRPVASR